MRIRNPFNPHDRRRPRTSANGRGFEALEGRRLMSAVLLSVSDATVVEGNDGTRSAAVVVSLCRSATKSVSVDYRTADGTASGGSDFGAVSGRLTFARGETRKTILDPVRGDRLAESDEWFGVNLRGATKATIIRITAVVTILFDEPPISVASAAATEGNDGTTLLNFDVSLSAPTDIPVTVTYATQDGSAMTADNDYLAATGTLTFAPRETLKTVSVTVLGDALVEPDETFYLNLSGVSSDALVVVGSGYGTVRDDDGYNDYAGPWDYSG